jgi:hypothetical protein
MSNDARELQSEIEGWIQDNLIHFSHKITHSNAPAGGIRLSSEQALDMPYVSARTHLHDLSTGVASALIELDYAHSANMGHMKRVRMCLGDEVSSPPELPFSMSQKDEIATSYLSAASGERPLAVTSPGKPPLSRLKQILLPGHTSGPYIAVTPLNSAGMAKLFADTHGMRNQTRDELKTKRDNAKKLMESVKDLSGEEKASLLDGINTLTQAINGIRLIPRVNTLEYGGTKPQNIGGRIHQGLSRPFVFNRVPTENPEIKRAYHTHFNGIKIRFPKELVKRYCDFLMGVRQTHTDASLWPLRLREIEISHFRALWQSWERQAKQAGRLLAEHADVLPRPQCKTPTLSTSEIIQTGWRDPSKRGPQWRDMAARAFIDQLTEVSVGTASDGSAIQLTLSPNDKDRILRCLEEWTS